MDIETTDERMKRPATEVLREYRQAHDGTPRFYKDMTDRGAASYRVPGGELILELVPESSETWADFHVRLDQATRERLTATPARPLRSRRCIP